MASLFNRRIEDTYQFLLHIEDSLLQDGLGRPREINMVGSSFINGTFSGDGSGLTGIITGSSVAGANKSIQFNNGGTLDGAGQFYYDPVFDNVGIGTDFRGAGYSWDTDNNTRKIVSDVGVSEDTNVVENRRIYRIG